MDFLESPKVRVGRLCGLAAISKMSSHFIPFGSRNQVARINHILELQNMLHECKWEVSSVRTSQECTCGGSQRDPLHGIHLLRAVVCFSS